jgi:hypothetical protein
LLTYVQQQVRKRQRSAPRDVHTVLYEGSVHSGEMQGSSWGHSKMCEVLRGALLTLPGLVDPERESTTIFRSVDTGLPIDTA